MVLAHTPDGRSGEERNRIRILPSRLIFTTNVTQSIGISWIWNVFLNCVNGNMVPLKLAGAYAKKDLEDAGTNDD